MKCTINTTNSNLSFGTIHFATNLSKTPLKKQLENCLNTDEITKLESLIESQKNNPVNIKLAKFNNKDRFYLTGCLEYQENTNISGVTKGYVQNLIESPLDFLNRLCRKADNIKKKNGNGDNLRKLV